MNHNFKEAVLPLHYHCLVVAQENVSGDMSPTDEFLYDKTKYSCLYNKDSIMGPQDIVVGVDGYFLY